MKKFLKFLLAALVVVSLLIVVAAVILPFVIDPNDFKPQITQQVKKATNRELTLGGDISLSVFPWLGVELKQVSLSNPPGFEEAPFAKAADMEVRVRVLPLLQRHIVMDTIVLRELELDLIRNAQGKTNWEDLAAEKPTQDTPEKPPEDRPPRTAAPLAGLAIAGLKIEAARIHWRDEVKNVHYTAKELNLTTDPLAPGKSTNVKLACDFMASEPQVKGHVEFRGNVLADIEANHYRLQETDLKLTATGEGLPAHQVNLQLGANAEAFLTQQQLTIPDLKLTSQVKGPQTAELALTTSLHGDFDSQQYNFPNLQLVAQIKDPEFPQPLSATLNTAANLNLVQEILALQNLNLTTMGIKWKGHLNGSNVLTEPGFNGRLVSDEFNPRQTAAALDLELPPTADDSVLNHARVAVKFSTSPADFKIPTVVAKLDDSTLKGGMAVRNFEHPLIRFDLAIDSLNVDRYLPPPSTKEVKAKPAPPVFPGAGAAAGTETVPPEILRTLNASGTLKIGQLTASGIHSNDIRISLDAKEGLIKLHPLSARLYQGTYGGDIRLDTRTTPPELTTDEKFTGVKIGPLLKDFMGDDKISGTADIGAKLNARGITPEAIRHTLNGTAGFSFTDGAVKGLNIPQLIRETQARLEGQPVPVTREPAQTDFTSLTGTITVTDGILRNNDLEAKSPFLRIQGQGAIDLVQESLDYQLGIAIVRTLQGQGGKGLADLKGVTIPLQISGTFDQPKYTLALHDLLKHKAKAEAEKLLEKKRPAVQDQLERRLDRLLGIQPNKETAPPDEQAPAQAPLTPEEQLKEEIKKKLRGIF